MNLFGMGMGEIALILLVALIIWGPERLPDIARSVGLGSYFGNALSFSLSALRTFSLVMGNSPILTPTAL
ncbi:twin-arginine translocase TatA/TatE family subunit [Chloroflexota bacterium]